MQMHGMAGTLTIILYEAVKPSACLQFFGTLVTQQCLHRSKRDLLEMKAVSLKECKDYFYKPK